MSRINCVASSDSKEHQYEFTGATHAPKRTEGLWNLRSIRSILTLDRTWPYQSIPCRIEQNRNRKTGDCPVKRSLGTKLYYSIGEVAELTQLQPHTLRAWEKEFNCLRPKRMGKNRAYRERDIGVILLIQRLLYQERYSTRGAQLRLKNEPDLVRTASDNVPALLKGEVVLPPSANQSATASEQTEPAPQEARPSSESGSSTPVEPRRDTRVEALRQQVLTELRELISLLS